MEVVVLGAVVLCTNINGDSGITVTTTSLVLTSYVTISRYDRSHDIIKTTIVLHI